MREEVLDAEQQGADPAADCMQPVVPLQLRVGLGPPPVLPLTQTAGKNQFLAWHCTRSSREESFPGSALHEMQLSQEV